ncbi:MAG: nuclear transport factor 2 family protein, partial [Sphingobacteriales bacterium]
MDTNTWVNDWLAAANSYDTEGYLQHWQHDAVLD